MAKLLKLEWLKIRRYRAFLILLGFFVVSIFGINYIVFNAIRQRMGGAMDIAQMMMGQAFSFPEVWHTVSFVNGFLLFIPGLMIILLMANEYSFRTNRQNVIDGLSRSQFINAKIALVFVIALVLTLLVFLTGIIFGSTGETPFSLTKIEYLGYFFINSVAYMSVAMVVVLILKRSGVSIGIYFLYALVVENVLSLVINKKILDGVGAFLPLESADNLIPMPTVLGKALNPSPVDTAYLLIASCVWILACFAFCKYRFQKSNL